jgi:hypothetical protein
VGPAPVQSPSLAGYPNADREVQNLASDLWGGLNGITATQRIYGKGRVIWGLPLADVLASVHTPKDVEFSGGLDSDLPWIHRRAGDADIYFVANRSDRAREIDVRFRVSGKEAELWHPDTGEIEPAGWTIADQRTTVPLQLAERESVFVVFRHPASMTSRTQVAPDGKVVATVSGPWDVSFPANWGAPPKAQFAKLESWTANSEDGIKYFSGTAVYSKTVQASASWFRAGARLILDLGVVKDLAEVSVNGKAVAPVLWKPPYRVDVTGALKPGVNQVEVRVTNQWTNRQVGDRVLPPEKRILPLVPGPAGRSGGPGFGPREPVESGLMGPVRVVSLSTP